MIDHFLITSILSRPDCAGPWLSFVHWTHVYSYNNYILDNVITYVVVVAHDLFRLAAVVVVTSLTCLLRCQDQGQVHSCRRPANRLSRHRRRLPRPTVIQHGRMHAKSFRFVSVYVYTHDSELDPFASWPKYECLYAQYNKAVDPYIRSVWSPSI